MLEFLYQTLILSGVIILLVIYYLRFTVSTFLKVLTEIIRMNEMSDYDPVNFVENLPPLMDKLGVEKYSYYFYYHETEYTKSAIHKKNSIKKFVYAQDFTVFVEISPGKLRWERSYLGVLLVETIFLLLKIDVNLQLKAISKALTQYNKINAFLSHDIKNLAQFINVMEHNLSKSLTAEKKDKLIEYLKNTAPSIKMRSDRVIYALDKNADDHTPNIEPIPLCELAKSIGDILHVDIEFKCEDISLHTDRKYLMVVFENIIKNFYDKSLTEPGIKLSMDVTHHDGFLYISFTDTGTKIPNTERIFEPFFTEKKGGLGIGLYHCRNIVTNMNGKMWAENTPDGPRFLLRIKEKG